MNPETAPHSSPIFLPPIFLTPIFHAPVFHAPVFLTPVFHAPTFLAPILHAPIFLAPILLLPPIFLSRDCEGAVRSTAYFPPRYRAATARESVQPQ